MDKIDLETRKRERPHVTKDDIVAGLRDLGLQPGALVVVHSSLSAFGYVEGGADAVIDAVLETVGAQGTVVMPTFHDADLYRAPKDPLTTPSLLGRIGDTFCRRPGVLREANCSIAATGPLAREVLAPGAPPPGRPRRNTFYRMPEMGGYILLLGVGQDRNSTLHPAQGAAVEDIEGVAIDIYELDGGYEFLPLDETLDARLIAAGHMTRGRIGEADVRLINGMGYCNVVREIYAESEAYRAHAREYLVRRAAARREGLAKIRALTGDDCDCLRRAAAVREAILEFRWLLMELARQQPGGYPELADLLPAGDIRLFADQLEGRLLRDFAATMALLRDERLARLVTERLA